MMENSKLSKLKYIRYALFEKYKCIRKKEKCTIDAYMLYIYM